MVNGPRGLWRFELEAQLKLKVKGSGLSRQKFFELYKTPGGLRIYDQKKTVDGKLNPPPGPFAVANNRHGGYASYEVGKLYFPISQTSAAPDFSSPTRTLDFRSVCSRLRSLDGYIGARNWGGNLGRSGRPHMR